MFVEDQTSLNNSCVAMVVHHDDAECCGIFLATLSASTSLIVEDQQIETMDEHSLLKLFPVFRESVDIIQIGASSDQSILSKRVGVHCTVQYIVRSSFSGKDLLVYKNCVCQ